MLEGVSAAYVRMMDSACATSIWQWWAGTHRLWSAFC